MQQRPKGPVDPKADQILRKHKIDDSLHPVVRETACVGVGFVQAAR